MKLFSFQKFSSKFHQIVRFVTIAGNNSKIFMDLLLNLTLFFSFLVSLIFFLHKLRPNSKLNLPPGNTGWPFIGETMEYSRQSKKGTPEKFITDRTTKFSQHVFKTSLLGHNMSVLCGPSGHKFVFSNENKCVAAWWPPSLKKIATNHETVEGSFLNGGLMYRNMLSDFLKPEALQRYVPVMDSVAKHYLESDKVSDTEVRILPLSKHYTFAVACRILMSIDDPEVVASLEENLSLVANALVSLPVDFPGTTFRCGIKAGKTIRELMLPIIKQRKQKPPAGSVDLLTRLLSFAKENGVAESEKKVAGSLLGLLLASHDTTSSSLASVVYYLVKYPHIYEEVLKEQKEIAKSKAPGEFLNWEDVKKMKYSWCVACESMRLSTPSQGAFRDVIKDFTYAGFTIPKGWKVYWTPCSTSKNPEYFPNPETFDPTRFEGNGPVPFAFVPFGGGLRMCPGKEFARLEILVFIHNLVTKFKLKKVDHSEKIIYNPFPTPVNGLPVYLQQHNN